MKTFGLFGIALLSLLFSSFVGVYKTHHSPLMTSGLLGQYQQWGGGYDPQVLMNRWQGQVLNLDEQTRMRPQSDQGLMYGQGSRTYPGASTIYPSQPFQFQQQMMTQPWMPVYPAAGFPYRSPQQPFSPQPYHPAWG